MGRARSNLSRIRSMTTEELAGWLDHLVNSEICKNVDFGEYLSSDNPQMLPKGKKCTAVIYARVSGHLTDLRQANIIIMSDNVQLFGKRYYKVFDTDSNTVHHIEFDLLEVTGW